MTIDRGHKGSIVAITLLALTLLISVQTVANGEKGKKVKAKGWPMFGHDPQHTGRSPYRGPQDPKVKWVYVGNFSTNSYPVVGEHGTIYVANSGKDKLLAISPAGVLKWGFDPPYDISTIPVVAPDGRIIFGTQEERLYAFSPRGNRKWRVDLEESGSSVRGTNSLTVTSEGRIYVVTVEGGTPGSMDTELHALTAHGSKVWNYEGGSGRYSIPAVGPTGTVYLGTPFRLLAISREGKLKWKYRLEHVGRDVSSPSVAKDGTVYIGTETKLYAFNPEGNCKWVINPRDHCRHYLGFEMKQSLSIGPSGTVYFAHCAYKPNGNFKRSWKLYCPQAWGPREAGFSDWPLLVDKEGTVYMNVFHGHKSFIYAITNNGNVKWKLPAPESSPISMAPDGTIYVVGDDCLYAIGTKQKG